VSKAEAARPPWRKSAPLAQRTSGIMDMHTHFLRDDTRYEILSYAQRGRQGRLEQALAEQEQTIEDLKYANYVKEMFSTATPRSR
jgi:hypothetical protein